MAAPTAVTLPAPRPAVDDVPAAVLPALFVPEASQWLSTSSGRIAGEGYSWMQAVHWVAGSGLYRPRRHRSHGPRSFGPTTVRVAQELAALLPCHPGIDYLVRRTGLAKRTVEYHLGMLREAGLLAWIVKGTRVPGGPAQASEFARMIPTEFDAALGIRTVQRDEDAPAYTRAMSGISEAGRELMATLAKKASRKVRKPRSKPKAPAKAPVRGAEQGVVTVVSDETRCTPMQVGTSALSTAGTTSLPPESKLASGKRQSPTPKRFKAGGRRGQRTLNRVGRRFQLAAELITQVPWLRRAAVPRIAWVVRDVANAGWTATEVTAWLETTPEPQHGARRPSGLLASRLRHVTATPGWRTPEQRAQAVATWRSSRAAERQRHAEHAWTGQGWQLPTDPAVTRRVQDALNHAHHHVTATPTTTTADTSQQDFTRDADGLADLTQLTWDEIAQLRTAAKFDPNMITLTIAECGETYARSLFTHTLVDQALRQTAAGHLRIHAGGTL
ncbi:transcriptional regulator [Streptomyces sp. TRM 70351]|uniref:transcriptional regulator n=1 Tax=Streptomyces sp. TRM 70351 TaxID=3116552 RepID=UPI002E7BC8AD|nr:transcriptional regulator [Streptomyces sp. TRM 70351]MEE1931423.1 transcriptional regulator [Streptomyces sp. TRM 70351]